MTKTKVLWIAIIVLMLSNLFMMYRTSMGRHRHEMKDGPKAIILEKLHFNDEQTQSYLGLIADHQQQIRSKEEEILQAKKELYQELKLESSTKKDSIISELGVLQTQIEYIHYDHFSKIKAICKADQSNLFASLVDELAELFSHPPAPDHRK